MSTEYKDSSREFKTDDPEVAKLAIRKGLLQTPPHQNVDLLKLILSWPMIKLLVRVFRSIWPGGP